MTLLAFTHRIRRDVLTPNNLSDNAADRPAGRVAMLVKNTFEFDARVEREARALAHEGWNVAVVALHDGARLPLREHRGPVKVVRVPRLYGGLARLGPPSTVAPSATREGTGRGGTGSALLVGVRRLAHLVVPVLRGANTVVVDQRMAVAAALHRPDVVHAHDLNTLGVAARLASRLGARIIYDSHELHTHRAGDRWHARITNHVRERRLIGAADRVITSTAAYADHMAHRYRIPPPTVVRNIPDTSTTHAPLDLHENLGLAGSRRLMLYEGSVQPHRGLEQAIAALALLPDWDLVVIGYGQYRPSLERAATRHGVRHRVHFTGAVDHSELLRWTAGADVGLCLIQDAGLSYRWSLPNKLFEYLHAGIPAVVSDFGEMTHFVQHTGAGTTANPDDSSSIAAAVEQADKIPRELLDGAAANHLWSHEASVLLDAYASLHFAGTRGAQPCARPVVLFVASNGIGAGHLTRVAAVARELHRPLQPVVATMSDAVAMLEADGTPYEHIPSRSRTGLDVRSWNGYLRERLRALIASLRPAALVFDGTWPYEGLLEASMADTSLPMVWMRRGMWRRDTGTAAAHKASWFDLVVEPGDLAAAADEGPTTYAHDALKIGPITYLESHETLGREHARRALDLPLNTPCALFTLGAGHTNQRKPSLQAAAAELAQHGFTVCATDPAVSGPGQDGHQLRTLRLHPLSRYLKAFDCVVSAAGYNTFHELLGARIPTLFVPNEYTAADDQSARARWAAAAGVALACRADPEEMRSQARSLASPQVRARLATACTRLPPLDGSRQAATLLTRRYAPVPPSHPEATSPNPGTVQQLRRRPSVRRLLSFTYPPRWRERRIDEALGGPGSAVLLWCIDWSAGQLEDLVDAVLPQLTTALTWVVLTSTPAHLPRRAPNVHFEHVLSRSDWSRITPTGAAYENYLKARLNALRTRVSSKALVSPTPNTTARELHRTLRARGIASNSDPALP